MWERNIYPVKATVSHCCCSWLCAVELNPDRREMTIGQWEGQERMIGIVLRLLLLLWLLFVFSFSPRCAIEEQMAGELGTWGWDSFPLGPCDSPGQAQPCSSPPSLFCLLLLPLTSLLPEEIKASGKFSTVFPYKKAEDSCIGWKEMTPENRIIRMEVWKASSQRTMEKTKVFCAFLLKSLVRRLIIFRALWVNRVAISSNLWYPPFTNAH